MTMGRVGQVIFLRSVSVLTLALTISLTLT